VTAPTQRRAFIRLADRNKKAAATPAHSVTLLIAVLGLSLSIFNAAQGWRTNRLDRRMELLEGIYRQRQQTIDLIFEVGQARDQVALRLKRNLSVEQRKSVEIDLKNYNEWLKGLSETVDDRNRQAQRLTSWRAWTLDETEMAQTRVVLSTLSEMHEKRLATAKEWAMRERELTEKAPARSKAPARGNR
jgi:hypothetical protein